MSSPTARSTAWTAGDARHREAGRSTSAVRCSPAVGAAAEPGCRGVDGLVALGAVEAGRDVGRQRHLTDPSRAPRAYRAFSWTRNVSPAARSPDDRGRRSVRPRRGDPRSRRRRRAGRTSASHVSRSPKPSSSRSTSAAPPVARRNLSRAGRTLVSGDDDDVAGAQSRAGRPLCGLGGALPVDEQPGGVTRLDRDLGDGSGGQLVVELLQPHRPQATAARCATITGRDETRRAGDDRDEGTTTMDGVGPEAAWAGDAGVQEIFGVGPYFVPSAERLPRRVTSSACRTCSGASRPVGGRPRRGGTDVSMHRSATWTRQGGHRLRRRPRTPRRTGRTVDRPGVLGFCMGARSPSAWLPRTARGLRQLLRLRRPACSTPRRRRPARRCSTSATRMRTSPGRRRRALALRSTHGEHRARRRGRRPRLREPRGPRCLGRVRPRPPGRRHGLPRRTPSAC